MTTDSVAAKAARLAGATPPAAGRFAPVPDAAPLKLVHLNPAFAPLAAKAPPTAMAVPSMMSMYEKRFLYGLAKQYYRGDGIIIDGGIFLGASTRCFADGLRENANLRKAKALKDKPIVSFEKGTTNPGMIPFFKRHAVPIAVNLDDSFVSVVHDYLKPVEDIVDLRIGDIMQTAEDLEFPIEICFFDVLKLPQISHYCISKFYPKLIPGRSIVIQQDYFHDLLPYIKTDQEFLRAHFDYVGEVGSTAAFLCASDITAGEIDALRGHTMLRAGLPHEEQLRLASIAMQRSADPARRFMMALSKLRLVKKAQGREAAQAYLRMIKSDFPQQIEEGAPEILRNSLLAAEKFVEGNS